MRVAHGHQVKSEDDVYMGMLEHMPHFLNNCGLAPGNAPVDLMPWRAFVVRPPLVAPVPQHYIKLTRGRRYRDIREVHDFPVNLVGDGYMKSKTIQKSYMSDNLEKLREQNPIAESDLEEKLEDIKSAVATIFAAGEDTLLVEDRRSSSLIGRQPVQRDVQSEGYDHDRKHSGNDARLTHLPCQLSSTCRGSPQSQQDEGNHSRLRFGDFVGGRHFAESAIWNVAACTLAALEILPPKDERRNIAMPELVVTKGLTSAAVPFNFHVRPRSEKARALIAKIEDQPGALNLAGP
ncbi:hypothetical protein PQX77_020134 [Marasmius sp. AFHP31]|nr:hypothetical protein PQX77_020134 [Marasmius sp. AFHP31]